MIWISRGIIFILFLEASSFIASKLELLLFNDPPGAYNRIHNGDEWRTEKELWGAWHKLNSEAARHQKSCFDITYESNDVGARDQIDYLTLENDNNIAVIGDSFAEGYGIDLKDTFAFNLKKNTDKQGLNFGASGNFGPLQEYLIYKLLVSKIPHNEVVYFFLPANDFYDNDYNSMDSFGKRFRPYFYGEDYKIIYHPKAIQTDWFPSSAERTNEQNSFLESLKTFLVDFTWTANSIRTANNLIRDYKSGVKLDSNSKAYNLGYFTSDNYSVNGALLYVEKLFSEIPNNFVKTIFIIPSIQDLKQIRSGQKYKNLSWYKQMQNIAYKNNARFIDLATFNAYDDSLFLECDGHWNSKGNKFAMDKFIFHDKEI